MAKLEFDQLKLYFGEPYTIDLPDREGVVTITPPTIGDIVEFGEKEFYDTVNIFIANTTMFRAVLWDLGMDWNNVSNFELFLLFKGTISDDAAKLLMPDITFSNFNAFEKTLEDNKQVVLYDPDANIEIDSEVYEYMSQYIRNVFKMFPEDEFTKDELLKTWWIEKDKRDASIKKQKNKDTEISIQPIISACINHPGFKYKLKELKDVNVCEFYDSVERLQIYEQSTALLSGLMGGFIDGSKIKPDEYNFMRSIEDSKK